MFCYRGSFMEYGLNNNCYTALRNNDERERRMVCEAKSKKTKRIFYVRVEGELF